MIKILIRYQMYYPFITCYFLSRTDLLPISYQDLSHNSNNTMFSLFGCKMFYTQKYIDFMVIVVFVNSDVTVVKHFLNLSSFLRKHEQVILKGGPDFFVVSE